MRRTRFFFRWWGKRKTPNQNSHNLLFSSFFSLSAIHPPNSKTLSHSLQLHSQRSYVCDVNGFSMVKNSRKYYDDAAGILRSLVLSAVAPHRLTSLPPPLLPPPASASSTAMSIATISTTYTPLRSASPSPKGQSARTEWGDPGLHGQWLMAGWRASRSRRIQTAAGTRRR